LFVYANVQIAFSVGVQVQVSFDYEPVFLREQLLKEGGEIFNIRAFGEPSFKRSYGVSMVTLNVLTREELAVFQGVWQ
jgi:hypothetical protein